MQKAMFALSVVGLLVAVYLVLIHYTSVPLVCSDTGIINCANVLNSQYAVLFGFPIADYGLVFFIIELAILILLQRVKQPILNALKRSDVLILYNGVGLAFVLYLLYAEYMVHNICIYCTAVHIVVVLLFILSFFSFNKKPRSYYKNSNPY